jgi:mannitol/fructose-specific phosphotransferase system IIA component (Ntr-type)
VFKKLIDQKNENLIVYACFIQRSYPDKPDKEIFSMLSTALDKNKDSEQTKTLSDFIDRINSYGL